MSNPEYRLRVLSPDGTEKHVLTLNPPPSGGTPLYLDGGPRAMEVGPLGDCREAVFEGDPTTLGIGPRDTVQVQYRPVSGSGSWLNRYAGTAVINGSLRSEIGRYKLQGFKTKRLNEVEVRTLLVEADLGAQVRQLFTDLIVSGQVGASLQPPTLESIPDLNKTSAAIHGNYWQVARLIEQRLKGRSERTRAFLNEDGSTSNDTINPDWGVNADLRPVFGYPTGVLTIDEGVPGVEVDGMDLDSTTLVTDVRLIWTKTLSARLTFVVNATEYINLSSTLTVGLMYPVAVAPRTFGQAWRSLPLPVNLNVFRRINPTLVQAEVRHFLNSDDFVGPANVQGDLVALTDGDGDSQILLLPPSTIGSFLDYVLTLTLPAGPPPVGVELTVSGARIDAVRCYVNNERISFGRFGFLDPAPGAPNLYLFPSQVLDQIAAYWGQGPGMIHVVLKPDQDSQPVRVNAFAPLEVNPELALATASPLARVPTLDPVECRVPGWEVNPAEQALIILRHPVTGVELSRVQKPIELLVYDTDDDGELFTRVRCGQRDDAEKLSFAASITERDSAASLDAVRSSG
ncbi:hypothetical protein [Deinococcus sp. QL22]|uniref:hypothetical protein n=1 Tax=Deinococcus sp. QL22 TaxID=2939437 RepID=UPI0020179257|nr:hypothetical protein [Deinococcus sp. QL22]UQN06758.1 hypothetical protein M1R55_02215 [Deinococcus sp. QL22]